MDIEEIEDMIDEKVETDYQFNEALIYSLFMSIIRYSEEVKDVNKIITHLKKIAVNYKPAKLSDK